jgi:hypothetical protein
MTADELACIRISTNHQPPIHQWSKGVGYLHDGVGEGPGKKGSFRGSESLFSAREENPHFSRPCPQISIIAISFLLYG